MATRYKIFVLLLTSGIMTKSPKSSFTGSKRQKTQQKLVKTVIYNLERFDDLDIVVEFFNETLKEIYEFDDPKEIIEYLDELLYKQGLALQKLVSYKDIRILLNSKLQELSTYTDDSIAGKFDRLSVQLKNELRRLSEYDREKLVKDLGSLSDQITSKYSPKIQKTKPLDKQLDKDEIIEEEVTTTEPIEKKLDIFKDEIIKSIHTNLQQYNTITSKLDKLENQLNSIIKTQTNLHNKLEELSQKMEKRDKTVKKIRNSLKRERTDEFTKTSKALDKIDDIPKDDEDLVVSEKNESDDNIDEKELEESLTDSIKEFLEK